MTKSFVLALLLLTVGVACGLAASDPTPRPTNTPRPTLVPTVTLTPRPTPTRTPRPLIFTGPTATPTVKVVDSGNDARNIVWAHLSRCINFDPRDLVTYNIQDDWFVTALVDARQQYGIWRVNSYTGEAFPHDPQAEQWEILLGAVCDSPLLPTLVLPTITPKAPVPTPILRSPSEAVNVIWGYLVKCFPALRTTDLESQLDLPANEYVVKDKNVATTYGVWRVDRFDGTFRATNEKSRSRQLIIRTASC